MVRRIELSYLQGKPTAKGQFTYLQVWGQQARSYLNGDAVSLRPVTASIPLPFPRRSSRVTAAQAVARAPSDRLLCRAVRRDAVRTTPCQPHEIFCDTTLPGEA